MTNILKKKKKTINIDKHNPRLFKKKDDQFHGDAKVPLPRYTSTVKFWSCTTRPIQWPTSSDPKKSWAFHRTFPGKYHQELWELVRKFVPWTFTKSLGIRGLPREISMGCIFFFSGGFGWDLCVCVCVGFMMIYV